MDLLLITYKLLFIYQLLYTIVIDYITGTDGHGPLNYYVGG